MLTLRVHLDDCSSENGASESRPETGIELLDEIAEFDVDETWFNPGSADADLRARATELGLDIIEACSIVDLGVSPGSV